MMETPSVLLYSNIWLRHDSHTSCTYSSTPQPLFHITVSVSEVSFICPNHVLEKMCALHFAQAELPPPDVQEKAAGVPLPPAEGEESEVEEESIAPAVPGPRPAAAPEERAAATALPASSEEEDSYDSSAERESETSSSSAAEARAAHTALPRNDESHLADDADSGASRADSFTADQRPSISRLDISRQADGDDEADSAAPFGPLSGRKLDFGLAGTGLAEEAHKKPIAPPAPQIQEPVAAAPLPWTLPAPAPAIAALTRAAASTSSFSFGSMPAFGTGLIDTLKPASMAGSSAAASSGTVLGSVPSTAPPANPGIFGSAPAFASGIAAPATPIFSMSQVCSLLPSALPFILRQSLCLGFTAWACSCNMSAWFVSN